MTEEVKDFILWARDNGVMSLETEGVKVVFKPSAVGSRTSGEWPAHEDTKDFFALEEDGTVLR